MNLDYDQISKWAGQIAGAGAIAWPIWRFLQKRVLTIYGAFDAGRDLTEIFGQNAAQEIKNALAGLRRDHDRVAQTMEIVCSQLKLGIYICDADGLNIYASNYLCRMFHLTRDEMKGWGWTEAVHPADRKTTREAWTEAVKNNLPYEASYRLITDKGVRPCTTRAYHLADGMWVGKVIMDDPPPTTTNLVHVDRV